MKTFSKNAIQFEQKLLQLAHLMADGKGESPEAFNLRDVLEDLEYMLPRNEAVFLRWLSSDLYIIEGKEILDSATDYGKDAFFEELKTAFKTNRWKQALELLRYDIQGLSNEHRAYFRGRAYKELGLAASAAEFFRYAIDLNKNDVVYRYLFLDCLSDVDLEKAAAVAQEYIADPYKWPAVTVLSGTILWKLACLVPTDHERKELYQQVIDALPTILDDTKIVSNLPRSVVAQGYISLGFSLDGLGYTTEAIHTLDIATAIEPDTGRSQLANEITKLRDKRPSINSAQESFTVPQAAAFIKDFIDPTAKKESDVWQLLAA